LVSDSSVALREKLVGVEFSADEPVVVTVNVTTEVTTYQLFMPRSSLVLRMTPLSLKRIAQ
jgi:hypothetical protein